MKIILVDDEILTIKAIRKMIERSGIDVNIAGEASNGIEAYNIICNERPDIAIVDIRMPHMDGIELMRKLRAGNIPIKIIVLSAYRDFEYAQKAIQYGACGYLVKPVDPDKLKQIIDTTVKQIKDENYIQNRLVEKSFIIRQNYLRDIIKGVITYSELKNDGRLILQDIEKNCRLMVINILGQETGIEKKLLSNREKTGRELQSIIDKYTSGEILFNGENELIVLFKSMACGNFTNFAEEMAGFLRKYTDSNVSVCISGMHQIESIDKAYLEAQTAAVFTFYLGENAVIIYDDIKDINMVRELGVTFNEDALLEMIRIGNMDQIKSLIDKIADSAKSRMNVYPAIVYNIYFEIIFAFKKIIKDFKQEQESKSCLLKIEPDDLRRFRTLEALKSYIIETTAGIIQEMNNSKQREEIRIIEKVKRYCEENYSDEITLETIAEVACMSRNYFCAYFKEYTNETFWNYLTRLRMEKAREYLLNTELKVNTISSMVGYKNASHFGRIFRNYFKCTPEEYRERAIR